MISNTPQSVFSSNICLKVEVEGEEIDLWFRRYTIKDTLWAEERFGGEKEMTKAIDKVDPKVFIPLFFRQLTPSSKKKLEEFKKNFVDYDEEGNKFNLADSVYEVFLHIISVGDQFNARLHMRLKGIAAEQIDEFFDIVEKKSHEYLSKASELITQKSVPTS